MLSTCDVSFTKFALFLGVSMSVTAFPVLARILTDRKLHQTELGAVALTCAAADDVTAWCLLALVVGDRPRRRRRRPGRGGPDPRLTSQSCSSRCGRLAGGLVREAGERLAPDAIALALVGLLLSSLTTEFIGIHAIFGAFLARRGDPARQHRGSARSSGS